jgi:streptogramin lyase
MHPLATARSTLAATTGRDGKIYALGGVVGSLASDAVEVYDPIMGRWSALPAMPTARAWLAAVTAPDGRIYAIGGQLIALATLADGGVALSANASGAVEVYDPASGHWSSGPSLPTARWAHAAVLGPDGAIYVMGGQTDSSTPTDAVERLLPDGGWQGVTPLSSARSGLAAAVGPDGRLYAVSGYIHGGAAVGTLDVYDTTTGNWSAGNPLPTPRYGLAAATAPGPNGYLFTLGGGVPGPLSAIVSTVEVLALVGGYQQWQ